MCLFSRKPPTSPSSRATPVRLWQKTEEAGAPLTPSTSPPLLLLVGLRGRVGGGGDVSCKLVRVEVGAVCHGCASHPGQQAAADDGKAASCSVTSGFWLPLHDAAARSLVFTLLVMLVLQTGSCMPVQSVISKGTNPLFTRLSARELLWKQRTRSTGFKVREGRESTLRITV